MHNPISHLTSVCRDKAGQTSNQASVEFCMVEEEVSCMAEDEWPLAFHNLTDLGLWCNTAPVGL